MMVAEVCREFRCACTSDARVIACRMEFATFSRSWFSLRRGAQLINGRAVQVRARQQIPPIAVPAIGTTQRTLMRVPPEYLLAIFTVSNGQHLRTLRFDEEPWPTVTQAAIRATSMCATV
jgi:hypothetical protein